MDKEIEKIDCKLWKNDYYQGLGDDRMFDYRDKVILRYGKLIGYRKPPSLRTEEIADNIVDQIDDVISGYEKHIEDGEDYGDGSLAHTEILCSIREIIDTELEGYRKPKGKPRLLSDEEIFKLFKYPSKDPNIDYELKPYKRHPDMASFTVFSIAHQVAKAQLDICVNEGEKPPFSVGFVDE